MVLVATILTSGCSSGFLLSWQNTKGSDVKTKFLSGGKYIIFNSSDLSKIPSELSKIPWVL